MNLDEMTGGVAKTNLLYLGSMTLAKADANVVKVVPEKRTQAYVILDKTIFHPKSGGQPSDHGKITCNRFAADVKKAIMSHGVVVHWCKVSQGTPSPGAVAIEIDWVFRHLVMRRHAAAHLLDHCLAEASSKRVETTDSWLDEPCYVGYRGQAPAPDIIQRTGELANQMISQGAQVRLAFLTREQARQALENAPNFERLPDLEEVRTVTIDGCNPIPCGGTHVSNIKEIGTISNLRAEQMHDGSFRLHFSVGD
jgi:alanyl-tRNA synthetase